ncbi:hypothetical protein QBC35DRAFT_516392 [Podospora australis]|uniref:Uncharacterized protein n=1 Tax=Podospora australis TaxID=1536484 RepID=A0AAN6WTJ5_9PEZI|nr:hypothetical protein QBC35DRAFT_516392 [Podospora australis]
MAATAILPALSIAGLNRAPNAQDFELYNSLPHPEQQPKLSDATLRAVGELFVRHRAHDVFGIHLIHSHFTAPQSTILLGTQLSMTDKTEACWTKPVQPADGSFVLYEFHENTGDSCNTKADMVGPAFFHEFADFLRANHLTNLIALEVLDAGDKEVRQMALQVGPSPLFIGNDGIITCSGGTVYAPKKNNIAHQVFVDSKPLPTVEALKLALCSEGIIA